MKGWHFVRVDKRLGYGDNNIVAPGYVYEVEPPIRLCHWGLHASVAPLDALNFAPGPLACRVNLSGEIVCGNDKVVATRREVLWMADATETLRHFARLCALDVIHLWDAPDVVFQFLKTGDESLQAAAQDVAQTSARAAARAAAQAAAWDAAQDVARAAAQAATWAAAWDVVALAPWDMAQAAAWAAQNKKLTAMLEELAP